MSGGPPHHPHSRQTPSTNPAWNHLQVPNYFPSRQLQHAHMSNEHPLLHPPTWHTPTTEPVKTMSHSHLFNLEQMIAERSFQRHAPGVDLSLQRNGNQNGELPTSPISLSVRDANKINSLPAGAIDIQAVELTKSLSPGIKPMNPATKSSSVSPSLKSASPGLHAATSMMPATGGMMLNSPGLKSVSPGLKSASPGAKSTSPGLKSTSPGLKTTSPVLKIATTNMVSSVGLGLLSTSPGIVCTAPSSVASFGSMSLSPGLISTPSQLPAALQSTLSAVPSIGGGGGGIITTPPTVISTSLSTTAKPVAGPLSPGQQSSPKNVKKPTKRVDSILERLNPSSDKVEKVDKVDKQSSNVPVEKVENEPEKNMGVIQGQSVIVQPNTSASNSHDENSNSSSTVTNLRDEDVVSPYSANEDSMDSSKSRRKRKPSKTVKVTKDDEKVETETKTDITTTSAENNNLLDQKEAPNEKAVTDDAKRLMEELEKDKEQQRRRSGSAPPGSPTLPRKTRRKTSSESETIANIAAMVEQTAPPVTVKTEKSDVEEEEAEKETKNGGKHESQEPTNDQTSKAISVSVIRDISKEKAPNPLDGSSEETPEESVTPPKRVADTKSFVEVENKLQEMFAGITDETDEPKLLEFADDSKTLELDEGKPDDSSLKNDAENIPTTSQSAEVVTSTSNDISPNSVRSTQKRRKRKGGPRSRSSRQSSECLSLESTPKKKKSNKKSKTGSAKKENLSGVKIAAKKLSNTKPLQSKVMENFKDVYAYDSGSNASSSKSRGPFIQIRGPRDSPLSVSVVNAPTSEEDPHKNKKYHDDSEYRHKVRSKGLHCSTLSNKYDAQTRDATWICAFCKRGPHATDPNLPGPSPFNIYEKVPPPGDLFGPYIITNQSLEYERRIEDPFDKQFRSKKVARALDAKAMSKPKSSKRKYSDSSTDGRSTDGAYLGITETKDKTYEVWAHEDCIIWSAGVYLVGSKIIGLEEAIWTSCNVPCGRCSYKGANVCCVKRGCTGVMHVGCARLSNWQLDEDSYKAVCVSHIAP